MRIVFDTNVYISAALNQGLSYEIFEKLAEPKSDYFLFISSDIWHELTGKLQELGRKKIISESVASKFMMNVSEAAKFTEPKEKLRVVKSDPDDDKILECAVSAQADLIVTMDRDLLRLKRFRNIGIVHPKTFSFMFPEKIK